MTPSFGGIQSAVSMTQQYALPAINQKASNAFAKASQQAPSLLDQANNGLQRGANAFSSMSSQMQSVLLSMQSVK